MGIHAPVKTLRSQLRWGIALVALLPIAVSLLILSRRIESDLREESVRRIDAALQATQTRLASFAALTKQRLEILGRDPQLRRLYLVASGNDYELRDYLAERRVLLGLDFLEIVATDGSAPEPKPPSIATTAPIPYRSEVAGTLVGGVAVTDSLLTTLARPAGLELVLRSASGDTTLASSAPGAALDPSRIRAGRIALGSHLYFVRSAPLEMGTAPFPTLFALVSAEPADHAVTTLRLTAAALGVVGVLLAILLGTLWSAQVARPVERLAAFSERVARGEWDEPLALKSVQELESLVGALDRMREDLRTYRDRLRVSERQAAWGQMARKVAHEIKNPLTPIAVSMEDLKRSFEQGRPDFPEILAQATRTVAEEVESMKRMLQELSDFGRFPAPRMETCPWERIASNLDALYRRDVAEERLSIAHPAPDVTLNADPGQIQQALVNLIQNGFDAAGPGGHVKVSVASVNTHVEIGVTDDGPGLTPEQRQSLFVPGFTTKEHGSGLGLTIVERIVNDHGGSIDVRSNAGAGATIAIRLPLRDAAASRGA